MNEPFNKRNQMATSVNQSEVMGFTENGC